MTKRYIIVGTSAAGIAAITKIRNTDATSEIICITAEAEMPYNRCLLADYLSASRPRENIMTRGRDFFTENNITLMLNSRVVEIEPQAQQISLHTGTKLSYDFLFLGIGKSAFVPPVPGTTVDGVFAFFDLKDADSIISYVKKHVVKKAVVVGAGLTGLECADALGDHNIHVTVVEKEATVLGAQIDQRGSDVLVNLMIKNGVSFCPSTLVHHIVSKDGRVHAVELSSGQVIQTDIVIFATGGRTNVSLVENTTIEVQDYGILTSPTMQTSIENIFAGGDVCLVDDLVSGGKTLSTLWPEAVMQGLIAGTNMTGATRTYQGAATITSSTIFKTTFVTCGAVFKENNFKNLITDEENFYHRLLVDNGVLKGFVMVGNIANVGQLRKAILEKQQLFGQSYSKEINK
jgi:NAD(P)H-nitrite reductase large subunit